jgi:hypothetical protein
MTGAIDTTAWRETLGTIHEPQVTAVLAVQCDLGWLRPAAAGLRDEIDEALAALAMSRDRVRIDRIVLHSLPAIGDVPPGDLAALNAAHADWLHRLAVAGVLLPEATRPRVHRLIVGGSQRSVGVVDGIELQISGAWPDPDAAAAALGVVRRPGATTPLTGYDIDVDGPFGDADPSIYL